MTVEHSSFVNGHMAECTERHWQPFLSLLTQTAEVLEVSFLFWLPLGIGRNKGVSGQGGGRHMCWIIPHSLSFIEILSAKELAQI